MELIAPPVVLVGSITAGCIWDGLACSKYANLIMKFVGNMRQLSQWHWMSVRECDAATTNLKLMAFEQRLANVDPKSLYRFATCSMHGIQHVVEQIAKTSALGTSDWSTLHKGLLALAHLFSLVNWFMRLVLSIKRMITVERGGLLRIVRGAPPPLAVERAALVRKYFIPPSQRP